ncbi:MAG: glycosyltransferase family 2 protein, partial [Prevotella sp.]|nr:glycosyltransferase family 2 protein [Prevotella sp.]
MKEITPKASVIVPVWNPGSGISRCVESLRDQTLEDIEMIFVDDCGTDGAMDIVRAAAAEDSRIRIITNTENVGPGISRNAGIDIARGEYLSFVDADDYVSPNFLEVLYTKAKSE